MALVIAPAARRAAVERLAHLRRARRPHRIVRLVEGQARLAPGQPAEAEQRLRYGAAGRRPARRNRGRGCRPDRAPPMRHQPPILAVPVRRVAQVLGIGHGRIEMQEIEREDIVASDRGACGRSCASGKRLLISPMWRKLSGRLSVTRPAPGMDRAAARPDRPPATAASASGRRRGRGLGIGLQLAGDQRRQQAELAAGRHRLVPGEDLLGERRARAEHAANEDRRFIRRSPGRARRRLGKGRDQPVDEPFLRGRGRSRSPSLRGSPRWPRHRPRTPRHRRPAGPAPRRARSRGRPARRSLRPPRRCAARSRPSSGSSGPDRAATPASRASARVSAGSTASARS